MTSQRRFKIYQDEAKALQTTHWDMDCLPAAEVDRLMRSDQEPVLAAKHSDPRPGIFWRGLITSLTMLALIASIYLLFG